MNYIYLTTFLILFTVNVKAHECVLSGTTAKEITIYNTCLSQDKKKENKISLTESMMKVKINKLKKENLFLKNKMLDLKIRFNKLNSILDLYLKEFN
tara:strand:+ start:833 stop:1123 length:291 start_codon:yes stop_codon:yes gene_type:complete